MKEERNGVSLSSTSVDRNTERSGARSNPHTIPDSLCSSGITSNNNVPASESDLSTNSDQFIYENQSVKDFKLSTDQVARSSNGEYFEEDKPIMKIEAIKEETQNPILLVYSHSNSTESQLPDIRDLEEPNGIVTTRTNLEEFPHLVLPTKESVIPQRVFHDQFSSDSIDDNECYVTSVVIDDDFLTIVLSTTFHHAASSIFVTSLTTSLAMFTNFASRIIVVRCFGVFCMTAILVNFVLVVTFVPAVVVATEQIAEWFRNRKQRDKR